MRVYLEAGWNRYEGDLDGAAYANNERRGWESHDNNLYAEIGLNFNIGKGTWKKSPDMEAINTQHQAALDALNARLHSDSILLQGKHAFPYSLSKKTEHLRSNP